MVDLRIAPIVEGHGEAESMLLLLNRIWYELVGEGSLDVIRPIRHPRSQLVKESGLRRAVQLAARKLSTKARSVRPRHSLILILIDADQDCPVSIASELKRWADAEAPNHEIASVVAHVEYETWFVAAASSLKEYLSFGPEEAKEPEAKRLGKAWVQSHFRIGRYSETADQPRLTAMMDLTLCRRGSPSFDKLCRELENRFP